jgi:hypothetical protein
VVAISLYHRSIVLIARPRRATSHVIRPTSCVTPLTRRRARELCATSNII